MTHTETINLLRFVHDEFDCYTTGYCFTGIVCKYPIMYEEIVSFYDYIIKNYTPDPDEDLGTWYRDGEPIKVLDIYINEFKKL